MLPFFIVFFKVILNCAMEKAAILNELTANGQISVFRRSPSWEKAFNLYNTTTKSHKNMNCGSCFRDVLAWLRS